MENNVIENGKGRINCLSLREGALRPRAFWFESFLDLHGLHVDPFNSVLKFGHSSGLSWVWSGKKKKKKKKQQLLLGVNGVHSTSSHSFEERGYENTNVIIMRDFNTFIKIKTGIYEFLSRVFKLKKHRWATWSAVLEIIAEVFL